MTTRLLLIPAFLLAAARPAPGQTARAGDYAARFTGDGLVVDYKGRRLSVGSYFQIWTARYKKGVLGYWTLLRASRPTLSADGRSVRLAGSNENGSASYEAKVSERGVEVVLRVTLREGVAFQPTEYPAFMIPAALVEGATVECLNPAGLVIARGPVPSPPRRGAFLRTGDGLVLHCRGLNIRITTTSPAGVHPFDARVASYGKRQGVWAFSTLPLSPGLEGVFVFRLRAEPADRPREIGTIRLAPNTEATAILLAADASERERFAADELAGYLEQITGRRLPVRTFRGASAPAGSIVVGRLAAALGLATPAELDAVKRDGYLVRVRGGRAAVCGWRDLGSIYAAYALLRRVGVKFYAPTCEIVPKRLNLLIPEGEWKAKPFFEFRNLHRNLKLGNTPRDDIGAPREFGEPGSVVHAAAYLCPFEKFHRTHPEYFALQRDGERLHKEKGRRRFDVHLCLSNPEVRALCSARLLGWMRKQPRRLYFGVSQGDGYAWCRCARCRAFDPIQPASKTDRLLDYVNAVVRRAGRLYPDKRVLTLAYTSATSSPPRYTAPAANVRVQFCPYPPRFWCQSHGLECPRNRAGFEDLKGWLAKYPRNLFVFDYPRGYKIWCEPFGSFRAMRRKLKYYAGHGVRGLFYCGVPSNFEDLFVFVQSRLLWNPQADPDALTREFIRVYYRAAAPFIQQYFDFFDEQIWSRRVHQMCEGANPGLVTPDYARRALALFAKAEAAVADDPAARYRVEREKLFVLFADVNERNPVNGRLAVSEDEFARRLGEFCRIARKLRLRVVGRREAGVVSDWLWRIARLRVRAKPWFADPLVSALITAPERTLRTRRECYHPRKTRDGLLISLDAFCGAVGPKVYDYHCPPRRAVWIYAADSRHPRMWARFFLDKLPPGPAWLELLAQDDDKPGAVRLAIRLNGKTVFRGPNPFRENGWSRRAFRVPAGALRQGENDLRIINLEPKGRSDSKWFMLAECRFRFGKK